MCIRDRPTYYRINKLIKDQDLPYQSISRTPKGIDFDQLETIFKTGKIKFFYTIPRHHYPLGHSYSKQEKEQILALAKLYDVYIVEDDYLGDYDPHFSPSFHYLDASDRVIYIKSFSTSLFSALRITSMVLPQALLALSLIHIFHQEICTVFFWSDWIILRFTDDFNVCNIQLITKF